MFHESPTSINSELIVLDIIPQERQGRQYNSDKYISYILSNHIGLASHQLLIQRSHNGKPYLKATPVFFNLSHSAGVRALYVSPRGEVGCDIQACSRKYSRAEIAKECFSKQEQQLSECIEDGFFAMWTLKEAYIKYKGLTVFDMPKTDIIPELDDFSLFSLSHEEVNYFLALYPRPQAPVITSPFPLRKVVLSDMRQ